MQLKDLEPGQAFYTPFSQLYGTVASQGLSTTVHLKRGSRTVTLPDGTSFVAGGAGELTVWSGGTEVELIPEVIR